MSTKDMLLRISKDLTDVRVLLQPRDGCDPRLRVFNAVSVAMEQVDYAVHIIHVLSIKEPEQDHNQASLPGIHIPTPEPEWCDSCDNPKTACTCHR